MSESETNDRIADALFGAIERGDIDAVAEIYAPDVEVWVNVTGRAQPRDANLELLRFFTGRVSELRYEVLSREFFPGGFLQRHVLHGKLASGEPLEAPVCLVAYTSEGHITRIFEYLDGASVQAAFA